MIQSDFFLSSACSEAKYPHLKQCTQIAGDFNGKVLRLHTTVDSKAHTYLQDHIFDERCFVPATMIIEMVFEAATWVYEELLGRGPLDLSCCALEDLFIERALAMCPGDSLQTRILLHVIESDDGSIALPIEFVSDRLSKAGKTVGQRRNVRATFRIGRTPCPCPDLHLPGLHFESYHLPVATYYSGFLPSLRASFHCATGDFALDRANGVLLGEYDCADRERRFIEGLSARFLVSPLGLDTCLQYTVLLAKLLVRRSRLPVACKKLSIHRAPPLSGKCAVLVRRLEIDDTIMSSDFYSFNSQGDVTVSALGCTVQTDPYHQLLTTEEIEGCLKAHRDATSSTGRSPLLSHLVTRVVGPRDNPVPLGSW